MLSSLPLHMLTFAWWFVMLRHLLSPTINAVCCPCSAAKALIGQADDTCPPMTQLCSLWPAASIRACCADKAASGIFDRCGGQQVAIRTAAVEVQSRAPHFLPLTIAPLQDLQCASTSSSAGQPVCQLPARQLLHLLPKQGG